MWIQVLLISSFVAFLNGQCVSNGKSYQVGDKYFAEDGCNTCICTSNGIGACTLMLCIDETKTTTTPEPTTTTTSHVPQGKCVENGVTYHVGEHYQAADGCNTCICSEHGLSMCTLMFCINEKTTTPANLPRAQTASCLFNGQVYYDGNKFISDDGCNTCICGSSGHVACTKIYCPVCHYDGKEITDGLTFQSSDGCNTCSCHGGRVACTELACVPTTTPPPACNYNGAMYDSGTSFMSVDLCNDCSCQSGTVVCTERSCSVGPSRVHCTYNGVVYATGDSFRSTDKCNDCSCFNGQVVCTEKFCIPQTTPASDPGVCTSGGKTYQKGETFIADDGCNHCFCTGNNLIACTEMYCLGVNSVGKRDTSSSECNYNGEKYKTGDNFVADDGCNKCFCDNGRVGCTKMLCGPTKKPDDDNYKSAGESLKEECYYQGQVYKTGENFLAADGCNKCFCNNARVGCTKMMCSPTKKPDDSDNKPKETRLTSDAPVNEQTGGCHYKGQVYWAGQSWMDGCIYCYCSAHGGSLCEHTPC